MKKAKPGGNNNGGFLPNSLRVISSCLKNVSSNATSVVSSLKSSVVPAPSHDQKEQVTWAGFDKLELSSSVCKQVLLVGYQNGFQVLDVDDASNFSEFVSRRDDGPVTFLQMQPIPLSSKNEEGYRNSFPMLLVVGGDERNCSVQVQNRSHLSGSGKDYYAESHAGNSGSCPTAVRFYSLRSHSYVHVWRFRSAVCMVRCSPRIVAVGLTTQVYCFDALTLENKFSVLTYPVPQVERQGRVGVNIGYGPMDVGPRWLAYACKDPLLVNPAHLSPQSLGPSPGVSPSTTPVGGTGLVAHYAMESGKQLAAGIVNLGDRGYKTLSKYCQELLPDSSPPLSPGSRADRSAVTEINNVGVVVVKDVVSRAVICQFRAHTTPISALCFDPSGTLLVTASVYGNTINIFRIMPSGNHCGSDSQSIDWSSSYVHLYKFHRGIRAAIIQDICFSRYSQWVAVVSSKGTCHVFVLSPFGGDVGFEAIDSQNGEPSVVQVSTLPWWSASLCTMNLPSTLPPSPVTLSVASRIKDNYYGVLNTVTNVAGSMSGKVSVPSGALAAVFHNSMLSSSRQVQVTVKPFEHLLVYTPSGHVVQHEIQLSLRVENDGDSRPHSGSIVQSQDTELNINIHPIQWWDVCRRPSWSEKENIISEIMVHKHKASVVPGNQVSTTCAPDIAMNPAAPRSNSMKVELSLSQERSHLHLSNAEVQYNTSRLPVWKKSKISFCVIGIPRVDTYSNGEYEIENLPVYNVETRQKDLLPVFYHFHSMRSALSERGISVGRYSNTFLSNPPHSKDSASEETIICHSKPASFSSTESSDGGSSRTENLLDLDQLNSDHSYMPHCPNPNEHTCERRSSAFGDVPLLDYDITATAADARTPHIKLPAVGVFDTDSEGALDSKVNSATSFLGLDAHESNATCLMLVEKTEVQNSAAFSCSVNLRKENPNQRDDDLSGTMFGRIEVDRSKKPDLTKGQVVTGAVSDPAPANYTEPRIGGLNQGEKEDDMLGTLCDFPGGSDETMEQEEEKEDADEDEDDEDDLMGAMFASDE